MPPARARQLPWLASSRSREPAGAREATFPFSATYARASLWSFRSLVVLAPPWLQRASQPSSFSVAGNTRRRPRPGALPTARCQLQVEEGAARGAVETGAPPDPRPASCSSPVASSSPTSISGLRWITLIGASPLAGTQLRPQEGGATRQGQPFLRQEHLHPTETVLLRLCGRRHLYPQLVSGGPNIIATSSPVAGQDGSMRSTAWCIWSMVTNSVVLQVRYHYGR